MDGAQNMATTEPLYLADFVTGLFAALAKRGVTSLSLRNQRLSIALQEAFARLEKETAGQSLKLKFCIRAHPIHGTDPELEDELTEAAKRDLISLDNPEYQDLRLKVNPSEAEKYLASVPGSPSLYLGLADTFMDAYCRSQAVNQVLL
jgi:hypothetical protein